MTTRDEYKVLLVDDDKSLLELVSMRLAAAGYAVTPAESGEAALACLKLARPDVVVADLRMDGMDGMALFEAIHRDTPGLPVVILTAHGTIPEAVAATQRGVFSFLTKPFDSGVLLGTVADAIRLSSVAPTGAAGDWRSNILTRSPSMEALLAQAQRAAASDASVCIVGQPGVGKTALAHAIHRASPRARGPFVALDCGVTAPELLEAELFGPSAGAGPNGARNADGSLRAADGGTLFLNEPGALPLALQARLVRVLEDRALRAAGSGKAVGADVRVICAAERGFEESIAAGGFREDLYYRLSVVKLSLPSLAERREDIPLLAGHFIERITARQGRPLIGFSPDAMEALVSAPWPGNIRQLSNVVEQVAALATTSLIPAALVRQALDDRDATLTPLDVARRAFERDYLVRILKITSGNVTRAARLAGRNRTEFYRLLDRHALEPSMFKGRRLLH
jgi:two-component system, NtrC family, response regulator GlrR